MWAQGSGLVIPQRPDLKLWIGSFDFVFSHLILLGTLRRMTTDIAGELSRVGSAIFHSFFVFVKENMGSEMSVFLSFLVFKSKLCLV